MSLSAPQKEIVMALLELYDKKHSLVKSKEIAARTGRDEGTVRNIMPVLRAIGLVNAIPGPKGGYQPTSKAYESFNIPKSSGSLSVPIYTKKGERTEVTVTDILFKSVFSPDFCQAILKVIGNISGFDIGQEIVIGPTPSGRMVIEGRIAGRDDLHGEILLDVITLISIPRVKVHEVMSKRIVAVSGDAPIKKIAETLYSEMIRAAPVIEDGKVIGMITSSDISRCVSEGKLDLTAREAATRKPVLISMNDDILQSMEKMQRSSIGRLVVVDENEKPVGIITRTDILMRILKPFEMIEDKNGKERG